MRYYLQTLQLLSKSVLFIYLLLSINFFSAQSKEELRKYIPHGESSWITHPMLEIRTVVHVVQKSEGDPQSITIKDMSYLNQQYEWINKFYREMAQPTLPTEDGIVHYVPDSRVRFVVDTVLFHIDEEAWDRILTKEEVRTPLKIIEIDSINYGYTVKGRWKTRMFRAEDSLKIVTPSGNIVLNYLSIHEKNGNTTFRFNNLNEVVAVGDTIYYYVESNKNCSLDSWIKYTDSDKTALHVFYTGSSKSGIAFGCGPSPYFLNVSNILKGGDWAGAQLTAHELGHTLGLRHTNFPQFPDLPKRDKFGFIDCNTTQTSNNIMGYNICRNYLSPFQIASVHRLYSNDKERILLTNANKYLGGAPIELWSNTKWEKGIVCRKDIVVRRGKTLVVDAQLHMASGVAIYLESKAKLIITENGKITNYFGDSWIGVIRCKSYERVHKMPWRVKNYGVFENNGIVESASVLPN